MPAAESGLEIKNPWRWLTPMSRSSSDWWCCSTPSAVTVNPKSRQSRTMVCTIAVRDSTMPSPDTK